MANVYLNNHRVNEGFYFIYFLFYLFIYLTFQSLNRYVFTDFQSAPKTSTKTKTTKIEIPREINETSKVENKEKTKLIKTINVVSSKVDKQIFF